MDSSNQISIKIEFNDSAELPILLQSQSDVNLKNETNPISANTSSASSTPNRPPSSQFTRQLTPFSNFTRYFDFVHLSVLILFEINNF